MSDKDKEAIKELVNKYCKAVNTQEKNDVYSIFSKVQKCNLISVGTIFEGVDSIYQNFLIDLIRKFYTKIELIKDEELKINFINENTAIVIFKYHTDCLLRENGEKFGIKGVETQVVVKEEGEWKITHIHYSKE